VPTMMARVAVQIRLGLPIIALALVTLTGCQSLSGGKSQTAEDAAGAISTSPASLTFGSVQVGNTASLTETVTNSGGSPVTITQANVTGTAFSINGLTLPTSLSPNQSITFTANFAPSGSGSASGSLSLVSSAGNSPITVALSGTGTTQGQLSVSPTSLSFGSVNVGSNSSLQATVSASGGSVNVSSSSSNSSEFSISGISLPVTLSAGESLPFTVTFAPNASGTATAAVTFVSNASNSPTAESLTGSGQAGQSPSVSLTWNASSGAVSYNVYRKLATDQNYTQIDSGDTTTAYTDNNVTSGATYDYVVTAVNEQNQESGYSNMAQAQIP